MREEIYPLPKHPEAPSVRGAFVYRAVWGVWVCVAVCGCMYLPRLFAVIAGNDEHNQRSIVHPLYVQFVYPFPRQCIDPPG